MKTARLVSAALSCALTFSGCRCACEHAEEPPQQLAEQMPADGGRLDPAQWVELIRSGNAAELKRLLKGGDPDARVELRPSFDGLSKQVDPAVWLRTYLKYRQLQDAYLYPYFYFMCPQATSRLGKDAAKLVETIAKKPSALLKKETYGLLQAPRLLHVAALFCQEPAARALLDAGAAVDARDARGITPLGYASCDSVAALLLERGAKADARFDQDLTPLHLAGDAAIARRLLAAGAAVDARERCGNTPLHFAAMSGRGQEKPAAEIHAGNAGAPGAVDAQAPQSPALRWLLKMGVKLTDALIKVLRELDVGSALLAGGADPKALNQAGHDASAIRAIASSHVDWDD